MEDSKLSGPFGDEPLEEVHLAATPLIRVIAQLRFPQLASMADNTVAQAFAKEVSDDYPLFEETREINLVIAGATISHQEQVTNPVWRLRTADDNWIVALGRASLSLEALSYTSRDDFCRRITELADMLIRKAAPPRFDRFGIRYINRVTDADIIARLPKLVRSEMLGAWGLARPQDVTVNHSLLEVQFNRGPHTLLVRCGTLPANTTFDPAAIPPINARSWILDIDSAINAVSHVQDNSISALAKDLAERAYRYFRYTVNSDFLEIFGSRS